MERFQCHTQNHFRTWRLRYNLLVTHYFIVFDIFVDNFEFNLCLKKIRIFIVYLPRFMLIKTFYFENNQSINYIGEKL